MGKRAKLILVLLLLSNVIFCIRAQNIELTKEQMYEDFDSLVSMIGYYNPHLEVYKKTMNFDVLENIKQMRSKIKNIENISAYYMLLSRCFNLIPEAHAKMLSLNEEMIKEYADTNQIIPPVIQLGDIQYLTNLYKKVLKESNEYYSSIYPITLTVRYINGSYYFARPCQIINEKDSFSCHTGDMIMQINGTPINSFVLKNHQDYYDKLRWDVYNHCFYTNFFLWVDRFPQKSFPFTSLTIRKCDGKELDVLVNRDTRFWVHSDDLIKGSKEISLKPYDRKPVVWLHDSLLYIKIPFMNPADIKLYDKKIRQLCKNKKVGNIILDVRRNGGGSDKVWEKLLCLLTDEPLLRPQILAVNTPKIYRDYIVGDNDSIFPLYDKLLDKRFAIIDSNSKVVANIDKKSIRCKGKIYILHDENTFSAANTLVTCALSNDKLVAVGTPLGYLSGYGVNPFVFQLPISKFLFMMHSVIHIPENNSNVDSYLWNGTEIRVIPTIRYVNLFEEYRQYDILYQYDFMNQYDPFFQAVIADINHKH